MKKFTALAFPILAVAGLLIFKSCSVGIPAGTVPVQNFDSKKYFGKWYEIARIDFRFEKNLNNVTAEYSPKVNGHIKVDNKGFDYTKNEWKQSVGEARFVGKDNIGRMKVSFFKPIWSGYNIIDLDEDYKYALVAGNSLDNLWILSREKTIPENIKQRFLKKAKDIGYNTESLIWVEHDK